MDFLDVCINKSLMIQAQSEMTKFFSSPLTTTEPVGNEDFSVVLESQNYVLVGFDMRKTEKLLPLFEHLSLDSEAPTLILAEVVLTYIEDTQWVAHLEKCPFLNAPMFFSVEEIFRRTASFFQNALFVNYEQVSGDVTLLSEIRSSWSQTKKPKFFPSLAWFHILTDWTRRSVRSFHAATLWETKDAPAEYPPTSHCKQSHGAFFERGKHNIPTDVGD
jgi:hypothetical protein